MGISIHTVQQRSPEWFKLRNGKVTGSNAHILLSRGLWAAQDANNQKPSDPNYYMLRGQLLEDDAIEIYEQMTGVDVLVPGFITNTKYPNAGASPDGVTGDTLIEVKAFKDIKHNSINAKNIPFEVMAQLQFNMMICELEQADLVLYNPDLSVDEAFVIVRVELQKAIVAQIERKLNED